jgi:23S rRNA pseudouridine1911/1915/1917 synthase
MVKHKYVVQTPEEETRLDRFLVEKMESASRVLIQKWIEDGSVTVNAKSAKASHKLRRDDVIEIEVPEVRMAVPAVEPWDFKLEILYEDESLLAINKPSGVITHPGAGIHSNTIANAALFLRPAIGMVGHPLRPGIVHRLDKETSGALLLAKTMDAYYRLANMFKERKIEKHYRALAYGKFKQQTGRIDTSLGRDPADRKKISTRAKVSRSAVTDFRVMKQFEYAALLDVRILTGRTHQIRVHLSSVKHPVVGDRKYGGGDWNRIRDSKIRDQFLKNDFFGLHASCLTFDHPISGKKLTIEAPLPPIWSLLD